MKTIATVSIENIREGHKKSWFLDQKTSEFEVAKMEGTRVTLVGAPFAIDMIAVVKIDIRKELYIIVTGGNVVSVVGDEGVEVEVIDWDNVRATEASFDEDEDDFVAPQSSSIDNLQIVEDSVLARVDTGEFVEYVY